MESEKPMKHELYSFLERNICNKNQVSHCQHFVKTLNVQSSRCNGDVTTFSHHKILNDSSMSSFYMMEENVRENIRAVKANYISI